VNFFFTKKKKKKKKKIKGNPFDQQLSNLVQQLFILNGVCNFEYIQKQVLLHQMDTSMIIINYYYLLI